MSGSSITQQPTTLNAIATGTVNIRQDPTDLLTVGLRAGTAVIGTANIKPADWSAAIYSALSLTIPSSIAVNTWVNGDYEIELHNIQFIKLIPAITTAASITGTNLDLRFAWSADATPSTRTYVTKEIEGTPSGGLIGITQAIKYWTISADAIATITTPIIIPVQGTWLQFSGRRNMISTTNLVANFNAQTV
jgi:hypothetical protein